MDSEPPVLQQCGPSIGAACAQHVGVGFKSQTFCWLLLAALEHQHTQQLQENCSTEGLCKVKSWHLEWKQRDRVMNTTHNPAQKSLHPPLGWPRPSLTWRVWDSGMCFDVLTLQDSPAGSKTTLTCLQTNPERFHLGSLPRVASTSDFSSCGDCTEYAGVGLEAVDSPKRGVDPWINLALRSYLVATDSCRAQTSPWL